MLLTAILVALTLSTGAIALAIHASQRVEKYRLTAPDVRALIRELDDALDKLSNKAARDGMRRLREARQRAAEQEQEQQPEEARPAPALVPGDGKSELYQLAAQRGFLRRG